MNHNSRSSQNNDPKNSFDALSCSSIIADHIPDALIITDAQNIITCWNASAERIYGWKSEEAIGKLLPDILKTEYENIRQDEAARKLCETGFWSGEITQRCRDGTRIPVLSSVSAIRDAQGNPIGFVFVNRSGIEQKRAEQKLLESEERFRRMFETHSAVMLLIEPDSGAIVDANCSAEKFYGYPLKTLKQMRIQEINILSDEEVAAQRKKAAERNLNVFVFPHRLANGNIRTVEVHSSPIKVNGKTLLYSIIHDVTASRQAEEALKKNEAKFRMLFDNAPMSGVIWRFVRNEHNEITDWEMTDINPKGAEDISGKPSELIRKRAIELFGTEVMEHYLRLSREVADSNQPRHIETHFAYNDKHYLTSIFTIGDDLYANISIDITDRKKAEEAIRASEKRFRTLVNSAPEGIFIQSEGRLVFVNPAMSRLLGAERAEDLLGTEFITRIAPKYHDAVHERIRKQVETGLPAPPMEQEYVRFDGSTVWVEPTAVPFRFQNRDAHLVFVRDITERKRAEQKLAESESRFRLMFEKNNAVMFMIDSETGYFLDANLAAQKFYGYSPDTFKTMKTYDLTMLKPEDSFKRRKQIAGEELSHFVDSNRLANGEIRTVEVHATPIRVNDKSVLFVITHDITDRISAEKRLKESEERFRTVADFTYDWEYWSLPDRQIIYMSPSCERITGYTADEFIADKELIEKISHPADIDIQKHHREIEFSRDESCSFDFRIFKRSGELCWINHVCQMVYGADGRWLGRRVSNRNITERKQTENLLRESQAELRRLNAELEHRVAERTAELNRINKELEHAAHAKDEFLANMSHELRTPLTGILGMSESLQEEIFGPLNEKQQKYMKNIETSGRHLLELINEILDLSKIEAGKPEPQFETVAVSEISQVSLSFVREPANKKCIRIRYTSEPESFRMVADARRLKQIIINLLNNAVKFTPERGNVSLNVRADSQNELVRFTVEDSGVGISAENLARLFTPFTQVDSSLSRQHEGTGLGLVMVRKLAELHGGGVSVESEVGKGSRFTVTLPWRRDTDSAVSAPPIQPDESPKPNEIGISEGGQRRRILLTEDNPLNAGVTQDYLTRKGYEVMIAQHGGEAMDMVERFHPDLILTDIQMPVTDGLELTRRLRNISEFRDIPIIALTALAMPGDRERCLQAGANEYMTKPFNFRILGDMIENLLKQK